MISGYRPFYHCADVKIALRNDKVFHAQLRLFSTIGQGGKGMFREDDRVRYKKKRKAKRLASQSFNYSAFVMASFIPTAWVLLANLIQFLMSGEVLLLPYRVVAVGTGIVWGGIVAWIRTCRRFCIFTDLGAGARNNDGYL